MTMNTMMPTAIIIATVVPTIAPIFTFVTSKSSRAGKSDRFTNSALYRLLNPVDGYLTITVR